jgi:TRAP-type uncharacterized transport system fused permease subunit
MSDTAKLDAPVIESELQELVAEADTGARKPVGIAAVALTGLAVFWSLFQLWYASPLPFLFGMWVLNDTEARAIHLGLALFLAYTAYPALKSSPRDRIPAPDWALAAAAAFAGAYLFLFYRELATRPGQPDHARPRHGGLGIVLLLEATRRSLGLPMVIVAGVFIVFTFAGPRCRGDSAQGRLARQVPAAPMADHRGRLRDRARRLDELRVPVRAVRHAARQGRGRQLDDADSIALLGHLRGGPAKVAVVSSALNGVVSGSSVSNVVLGRHLHDPAHEAHGLSGVKAGAIEAASSINGQIMPPVMGAAAFLMVEYVGIPYADIVTHAFLPAVMSYVALLYIVHLEALKINAQPIPREAMPVRMRLMRTGLGLTGSIVVLCLLYYGVKAVQAGFGASASWVLLLAGLAIYLASVWFAATVPDLELDDPNAPIVHLPRAWDVTRTGLDFLIPLVVLLWCLMAEEMSPGLSAFWATTTIIAILATRRPLLALFRRLPVAPAARAAGGDLVEGFALGARNMISIAIATATAGIIVGTVTLTGLGLMMTEFVEFVSGGNVIIMLVLIAVISLILGMGIPTTANYILVAT